VAERREDLRAADVDRQFVADRLKAALDEGRLSLHEYDDRLRETYAARTYGDLDRLLADLPGAERAQLVASQPAGPATSKPPTAPEPPARPGFPRWILAAWGGWITVTLIVNAVWFATVVSGGNENYWPIWVMLPWGAVLLAGTISGLATGGGGGGQNKWDRKAARRSERHERRRERRGY
jgi:Domain of unknown function (DUF1707)